MKRESIKLACDWLFHQGEISEREMPSYEGCKWTVVSVPHSWNDADTFLDKRGYYRGVGWYKRDFEIKKEQMDKTVLLEFGAAFGDAEIWVNGVYKGRFLSGFTGCMVNITKDIRPGTDNSLVVRVDNRHHEDILPAREEPDYYLYGGIYRDVRLITTSKEAYIAWRGVAVRTVCVDKDSSIVAVEVAVEGKSQDLCSAVVRIMDENRKEIAVCKDIRGTGGKYEASVEIKSARLWSVDSPYLYTAEVELHNRQGEILDLEEIYFGVRTYEFDPEKGFFLNGEPLKLVGVNRHQCYPGLGNALPESMQYEDARLIKEMGANIVRTSHYPQHPAFLDACDRLGLLVYSEIATWQTVGGDAFAKSAKEMMEEMIRRDRNHPSVIIWGMLNEGKSRQLFLDMHDLAKRLDPDRPTCYAENRIEEGERLGTITIPDVLGINYQLEKIDSFHQQHPNYSILISEYANSYLPRDDAEKMQKQCLQIAEELTFIEQCEYLSGGILWSMHDYGSDYEPAWPVQTSGVLDAFRIPKYSYYYLVSRWRKEPLVYIADHWTWHGHEGKNRNVYVISNCDSIELYVNNVLKEKKQGNGITVFEVSYNPGTIKAAGEKDGHTVEHAVTTAGQPESIRLSASSTEITADGCEIIVIEAQILDQKGIVVPVNNIKVNVSQDWPGGRFCGLGGKNEILIKMGIGRIAFKAGTKAGTITMLAEADGIRSGSCIVNLLPGIECS